VFTIFALNQLKGKICIALTNLATKYKLVSTV